MTRDTEQAGEASIDGLVAAIDAWAEGVRSDLEGIARQASTMHEAGSFGGRVIDEMAVRFEPQCLTVLVEHAPSVDGVGLVWEVGVEAGSDTGMLWWRSESGTVARKHHVFNPESDSFYDYRNSLWFEAALAADGLAVVGPYIDAWGTDDHTITASLRIMANGACIGVAAADMNVSVVTATLASILRPWPQLVLVDNEDRVVASNFALLSAGLRVAPFLERTSRRVDSRFATTVDGWQLLRLV
jgi:hypothetical protein